MGPGLPQWQRPLKGIGGFNFGSKSSGNGSPSSLASSSGNLNGNDPLNPTPKSAHQLSSGNPNNPNQNKKKKGKIDVKIVNGKIILRVMRDDMPFFVDETTARKKIYHAPDFDVALPNTLDLGYVESYLLKIA